MATVPMMAPIKRLREKGYSRPYVPATFYYFKFILKNKETVSLKNDGCRECIFIKKPKACVRHIRTKYIPQEPYFRMGSTNGRRNCAVNPKKKIKPVKWIPLSKRVIIKKKAPSSREARVLWEGLKQFAGQQTEDGSYEINGYIANKDMFRKAIKFGVIIKDEDSGKWHLVKAEGGKDIAEDKKKEDKKSKFKL